MSSTAITTNTTSTHGPSPTDTLIVGVTGTWDSATFNLYALDQSGNQVRVMTATSDDRKECVIGRGNRYKYETTGGGGSLSITVVAIAGVA